MIFSPSCSSRRSGRTRAVIDTQRLDAYRKQLAAQREADGKL